MEKLKNYLKENEIEAGCDEAGRGCLVGPVYAAAVIWPKDLYIPELNDSKKLTPQKRELLKTLIMQNAIAYGIGSADEVEIDRYNILNASILAMHRALNNLKITPTHLLIDGNRFKTYKNIQHTTIIQGDGKYASIAAASILAKTYRDGYMDELGKELPQYFFEKHKGYATKQHVEAIREFGYTRHHRKSFVVKSLQATLFDV